MRFLILVGVGWVALRVAMLWPHLESAEDVLRAIAPIPAAAAGELAAPPPRPPAVAAKRVVRPAAALRSAMPLPTIPDAERAIVPPDVGPSRPPTPPLLPGMPRPASPAAARRPRTRWSGSAWLVARGGAGLAPGALGGQLGGSQAGVRLAYALDGARRVAIFGRVTSPLGSGLREAALGLEWQPTRAPVRVVVERRFALGAGRGGPAAGVVGGFGPAEIAPGFRLEGYGQAGVIRRVAAEAYVDGALRAAHPVVTLGRARIDLGAGLWGAAQRDAARLDLGPSLSLAVPLGRQPVRLSLDWRARVAGDAHPGSGPALTLGTDF